MLELGKSPVTEDSIQTEALSTYLCSALGGSTCDTCHYSCTGCSPNCNACEDSSATVVANVYCLLGVGTGTVTKPAIPSSCISGCTYCLDNTEAGCMGSEDLLAFATNLATYSPPLVNEANKLICYGEQVPETTCQPFDIVSGTYTKDTTGFHLSLRQCYELLKAEWPYVQAKYTPSSEASLSPDLPQLNSISSSRSCGCGFCNTDHISLKVNCGLIY